MMRWLKDPKWTLPFVVFFASQLFSYFILFPGNYFDHFGDCWVRWDSSLYLEIAAKGHTLFHCPTGMGKPDQWCGNAGWAPLYPWFIRLVSMTGISFISAGILISRLFFFGYLKLLAHVLEINSFSTRNWLLIFIAAFCPGNIYYHAVFPLSQAVFFMTLMFWFLKNNKFTAAGLAGAAGILSYGIGFFLLASMGMYSAFLFFQKRNIFKPFVFKTLLISTLGFIFLLVYDHFQTGHWNAMFLIQDKYGYSLNSPLKILGIRLKRLFDHPYSLLSWVEIQNLFLMALILFLSIRSWTRKKGPKPSLESLYLFFFWFLPYSASSTVGLYRNAAMLGPGITSQPKLPLWILWFLLTVFLILSVPLGILFVQSGIV